jgi:hypothetical protein
MLYSVGPAKEQSMKGQKAVLVGVLVGVLTFALMVSGCGGSSGGGGGGTDPGGGGGDYLDGSELETALIGTTWKGTGGTFSFGVFDRVTVITVLWPDNSTFLNGAEISVGNTTITVFTGTSSMSFQIQLVKGASTLTVSGLSGEYASFNGSYSKV